MCVLIIAEIESADQSKKRNQKKETESHSAKLKSEKPKQIKIDKREILSYSTACKILYIVYIYT